MNVNVAIFPPHGRIQCHTFASFTPSCPTPFCQTAPLLPSVTQQQNVMEYWWEDSIFTAIHPSASAVVGYHNTIGGITSGAALVLSFELLSDGIFNDFASAFMVNFQSLLSL